MQNLSLEPSVQSRVNAWLSGKYDDATKNSHTKEFSITQNKTLEDTINRLGFELTNYKKLG